MYPSLWALMLEQFGSHWPVAEDLAPSACPPVPLTLAFTGFQGLALPLCDSS